MQKQSWATLPGEPLACVKYKPAPPNSGYATKAYRSVKEQPVPVEGTVKGKVANVALPYSIAVRYIVCLAIFHGRYILTHNPKCNHADVTNITDVTKCS